MQEATIAALVGAAIGSAIGAAGVIGSAWWQQRAQTRREITKTAADLALADYQYRLELAKTIPGPMKMPPVSLFVAYHADVLRAIAADGFGPDEIRQVDERQAARVKAFDEVHEIRKKRR